MNSVSFLYFLEVIKFFDFYSKKQGFSFSIYSFKKKGMEKKKFEYEFSLRFPCMSSFPYVVYRSASTLEYLITVHIYANVFN